MPSRLGRCHPSVEGDIRPSRGGAIPLGTMPPPLGTMPSRPPAGARIKMLRPRGARVWVAQGGRGGQRWRRGGTGRGWWHRGLCHRRGVAALAPPARWGQNGMSLGGGDAAPSRILWGHRGGQGMGTTGTGHTGVWGQGMESRRDRECGILGTIGTGDVTFWGQAMWDRRDRGHGSVGMWHLGDREGGILGTGHTGLWGQSWDFWDLRPQEQGTRGHRGDRAHRTLGTGHRAPRGWDTGSLGTVLTAPWGQHSP